MSDAPNPMQQENDQLKANLKALQAQLDACKQMFNDGSNNILQLRTNMNMMGQQMNESMQKLAAQDKDIANYKDQIQRLIDQVKTLSPQPKGTENAADKK